MKRFLIKLLYFSVFTVLFYCLGIMLLGDKWVPAPLKPNLIYKLGANGHMFTRLQEIKDIKNLDILILGSSHAYRGYDTRIFKEYGYNTFNLGSSAQTPIQTLTLLQQYLDEINPKVVIYEVNPRMFFTDGVESSLDIIANDKLDKHVFEMAFKINHIKTYNSLIYAVKRDWLGSDNSFVEPTIKEVDKYVEGGFVEEKLKYYSPKEIRKRNITFYKDQIKAFEKCLEEIKENRAKIIFVTAPISKNLFSSYTNIDDFNFEIKEYAAQYNAEYYNFNEILNLSDSLNFSDAHHLNQTGVEIFNHRLLDTINFLPY